MALTSYPYTKAAVNLNKLSKEIRENSLITKALDHVNWSSPDALTVYFKDSLDPGEKTELDNVVTNHDGKADPSQGATSVQNEYILNSQLDFSGKKYLKVAGLTTDTSGGFVVPNNVAIGLFEIDISGEQPDAYVVIAYDWNGPSEKIFAVTRGDKSKPMDPKLSDNQVVGDGVKELTIVCVNDSTNQSGVIGGEWKAMIMN